MKFSLKILNSLFLHIFTAHWAKPFSTLNQRSVRSLFSLSTLSQRDIKIIWDFIQRHNQQCFSYTKQIKAVKWKKMQTRKSYQDFPWLDQKFERSNIQTFPLSSRWEFIFLWMKSKQESKKILSAYALDPFLSFFYPNV
jgi:hypothetical protein